MYGKVTVALMILCPVDILMRIGHLSPPTHGQSSFSISRVIEHYLSDVSSNPIPRRSNNENLEPIEMNNSSLKPKAYPKWVLDLTIRS